MGKIAVVEHLTLDGVMQAPGSADEDIRDGFEHGGWAAANQDDVMTKALATGLAKPASLLFGRRTYEHFHSFCGKQPGHPYVDVLNRSHKYVASRTLHDPLPWENSSLLKGDIAQAAAKLKNQGDDLVILGSSELVRLLMPHNLIDEYLLLIHPIVLGSGRRLFSHGKPPTHLRLAECTPTSKGVLMARYLATETILAQ